MNRECKNILALIAFVQCVPCLANDPLLPSIIAINLLAQEGELIQLKEMLNLHPDLVSRRIVWSAHRRPTPTDEYTPLHRAALHGHTQMVAFLIARNADLEADGGGGWTPLHVAAKTGNEAIVKVLLSANANVNAKTSFLPSTELPGSMINSRPLFSPSVPSKSPLDIARECKHARAIELLEAAVKK